MKKNILHISYDYTEKPHPEKTMAIKNLLDVTKEYSDMKIISLDRTSKLSEEKVSSINQGVHIKCFGLPYGLFLKNHLKHAYKQIINADQSSQFSLCETDLIHAHKLSFEGYIGYLLSQRLNCPLFISLRQTDYYVLYYRRDLIPLFKKVLQHASSIFYIAPFMIGRLEKLFGKTLIQRIKHKLVCLPNIINTIPDPMTKLIQQKRLLTVLKMTPFKIKVKNLNNLLKAIKLNPEYHLDIIGDGPSRNRVEQWIQKNNLENQVTLLGEMEHDQIKPYYQNTLAYVMPSYQETFGLVYMEALMCGTPILYSKGTGVDGYFQNVGIAVDPKSITEISDGIKKLVTDNTFYRQQILQLIEDNQLKIFTKDYISKTYKEKVKQFI